MVKVGKCALIGLMHEKSTLRVELTTKKTSHCKSQDFLRKRRLKKPSAIELSIVKFCLRLYLIEIVLSSFMMSVRVA